MLGTGRMGLVVMADDDQWWLLLHYILLWIIEIKRNIYDRLSIVESIEL